jgi:hypothetical protein
MKKYWLCFTTGLLLAACSSPSLRDDVPAQILEIPTSDLSEAPSESSPNLSAQLAGDWTEVKSVYNGPPASPYESDLSVNANGISLMAFDATTVRVSSGGVVSSVVNAIRAGNTYVSYRVVKTDAANNGYVAGTDNHSGQSSGMYVEKITGLGGATPATAWIGNPHLIDTSPAHYPVPGDSIATGVGVDSSANVYVGGSVCQSPTLPIGAIPKFDGQSLVGGCDQAITKYNAAGDKQWTRILGTISDELPGKISVSAGGSVFVTGTTGGAMPGYNNAGGTDIYVAKYNTNGTRVWIKQFGSSRFDAAKDIAVDCSGSLYLAASSDGPLVSPIYNPIQPDGSYHGKPQDGIIVRLNGNGVIQWKRRASLAYTASVPTSISAFTVTELTDLAVDCSNNVYVVGRSLDFTGREANDLPWPLKFSSSGVLVAKGKRNVPSLDKIFGYTRNPTAVAVGPAGIYTLTRGEFTPGNNIVAYLARYNFHLNIKSSNPADLAP